MKKSAVLVFVAVAMMLAIGIAGSAFSEGTTPVKATASDTTVANGGQACAAHCPKFVDLNKDGVCDSMAVHHKDGKCSMMDQCKKDGRCTGNCKNHAGAAKTALPEMKCDPTKCTTVPGGCPMKAKSSCSGTKK
jgi:hypothetical protein